MFKSTRRHLAELLKKLKSTLMDGDDDTFQTKRDAMMAAKKQDMITELSRLRFRRRPLDVLGLLVQKLDRYIHHLNLR